MKGGGLGVDGFVSQFGASIALDPAVSWTLRGFLAAIIARGLAGKLADPRGFADSVRGYELLPGWAVGLGSGLLLAIEVLAVPALLLPAAARLACLGVAGLLAVYTAAIGINLARGRRDIDCGCAGPGRRQTLHGMLVARNLVYAGLAIVAAAPAAGRSLLWLDAFTILVAAASLFALAVAVDGMASLAASVSRLARIGKRA